MALYGGNAVTCTLLIPMSNFKASLCGKIQCRQVLQALQAPYFDWLHQDAREEKSILLGT